MGARRCVLSTFRQFLPVSLYLVAILRESGRAGNPSPDNANARCRHRAGDSLVNREL